MSVPTAVTADGRVASPARFGPARLRALGVLLLLLAAPGAWLQPTAFAAAWLAAAWFALSLTLGGLVWLWIHRLTGGRWGEALRPAVLGLAARLPLALLCFVPVVAGAGRLYPWLAGSSAGPAAPEAAFLHAWQSPAVLAGRLAACAVVWLVLARRAVSPSLHAGEAAGSLIAWLVFTSLAAMDLLMALGSGWSSSGFALAALSGQAFAGLAAAIVLAAPAMNAQPGRNDRRAGPRSAAEPPVSRDLGNLLLVAVSLWAYLAFMQFLIVWAENLPREIVWYLPRLQTGWGFVGLALVALHLAVPLLLLLSRVFKDSPPRLGALAAGLVAVHALDAAWLVVPSVAPHGFAGWWLLPTTTAGAALLVFAGIEATALHGRAAGPGAPPQEVRDGA